MPYRHLTLAEREVISQTHFSGASRSKIGKALGRQPGTISREIERNTFASMERCYAHQAQWMAELSRSDSKGRFVQHSRGRSRR